MTTISILPESNNTYRAVAGDKESTGRTAGEALDALTRQFGDEQSGTLVIVQNHKADQFFNAAQQERLIELMQRREAGNLSPEEEVELESLVEAELDGARLRAERNLRHVKEDFSGAWWDPPDEELSELLSKGCTVGELVEFIDKYRRERIKAEISRRSKLTILTDDSEN